MKVTADGTGLIGHAGAILLRKAADQARLTAQLSGALRKKGSSPAFDRGTVLASLAAAIAVGASSMSDIALLAHLAPVFGDAPSGPTVRRTLDLAGTAAALDRIARARVWPTNNISERGVRPNKTQQKVSGCLTSEDATQDRLDISRVAGRPALPGDQGRLPSADHGALVELTGDLRAEGTVAT